MRTWTTGDKQYTETSHYALFRAGDIHFEDVTTAAYSAENKQMLEGILPFPSDALRDFSMPYLSGFLPRSAISSTRASPPRLSSGSTAIPNSC